MLTLDIILLHRCKWPARLVLIGNRRRPNVCSLWFLEDITAQMGYKWSARLVLIQNQSVLNSFGSRCHTNKVFHCCVTGCCCYELSNHVYVLNLKGLPVCLLCTLHKLRGRRPDGQRAMCWESRWNNNKTLLLSFTITVVIATIILKWYITIKQIVTRTLPAS